MLLACAFQAGGAEAVPDASMFARQTGTSALRGNLRFSSTRTPVGGASDGLSWTHGPNSDWDGTWMEGPLSSVQASAVDYRVAAYGEGGNGWKIVVGIANAGSSMEGNNAYMNMWGWVGGTGRVLQKPPSKSEQAPACGDNLPKMSADEDIMRVVYDPAARTLSFALNSEAPRLGCQDIPAGEYVFALATAQSGMQIRLD